MPSWKGKGQRAALCPPALRHPHLQPPWSAHTGKRHRSEDAIGPLARAFPGWARPSFCVQSRCQLGEQRACSLVRVSCAPWKCSMLTLSSEPGWTDTISGTRKVCVPGRMIRQEPADRSRERDLHSSACSPVPLNCTYRQKFRCYTTKKVNTATPLKYAPALLNGSPCPTCRCRGQEIAAGKGKRSFPEAARETRRQTPGCWGEGEPSKWPRSPECPSLHVRKQSIQLGLPAVLQPPTQSQPHPSLSLGIRTLLCPSIHWYPWLYTVQTDEFCWSSSFLPQVGINQRCAIITWMLWILRLTKVGSEAKRVQSSNVSFPEIQWDDL